jgi:putative membrane protein
MLLAANPSIPWHAHVDVWLLMLSIAALYIYSIRRRQAATGKSAASKLQMFSFLSGVGVLWLASDYPIHDIAENYLFFIHMVQHLMITLVAPPLLIIGMPGWMKRKLFCGKRIYPIARVAFAPVLATIVYNASTVFAHWPPIVDGALNYHLIHFFVHVWLFTAAWMMWMPVFNTLPELPMMTTPMKLIYLFIQSIIPTVPAAFITFSSKPLYSFYAHVPRLWGISVIEDQQLAGAIMKIVGGGFLWLMILILFFRWRAEEDEFTYKPTVTLNELEKTFQDSPPREPASR